MSRRPSARRLAMLAAAVLAAGALSACGHKEKNPTTADTEGIYVRAGEVTYQVQLSRQLNQYSVEDRGYLAGASNPTVAPNQMLFGVFMWAKNETHSRQTTLGPASFDIMDTEGNRYYPVPIDPTANPYAWVSLTLRPLGVEPVPGSTASYGPTQGGELLFKLDDTIYSNRPLTLEIHAPGQSHPTTISLDL